MLCETFIVTTESNEQCIKQNNIAIVSQITMVSLSGRKINKQIKTHKTDAA